MITLGFVFLQLLVSLKVMNNIKRTYSPSGMKGILLENQFQKMIRGRVNEMLANDNNNLSPK
jgi:hypothetical protein